MRMNKRFQTALLLALALVATLGLAGCSSPPDPVTLEDVPVYTGAVAIEEGENAFVDQLAQGLAEAVTEEEGVSTMDTHVYALPQGTDWEMVKSFYTDALDESWKAESDLLDESDLDIKVIGWLRDSSAGEQALVLYYLSSLMAEDDAHLIVALASE